MCENTQNVRVYTANISAIHDCVKNNKFVFAEVMRDLWRDSSQILLEVVCTIQENILDDSLSLY